MLEFQTKLLAVILGLHHDPKKSQSFHIVTTINTVGRSDHDVLLNVLYHAGHRIPPFPLPKPPQLFLMSLLQHSALMQLQMLHALCAGHLGSVLTKQSWEHL